jgi:hypothetical protein
MTVKMLVSALVAVTSAVLGGSLGAAVLEQANAAPLSTVHAHGRLVSG